MTPSPPLVSLAEPGPGATELRADLRDRWARARRAALPEGEDAEDVRALALLAGDADPSLRRVFDHSYRLGRSFSRWARADLTLVDLERLLPELGAPCLERGFTRAGDRRSSLARRPACGPEAPCAWWREAIGGLVSGLSSSVRHTRVAAGEGGCIDLLHVDHDDPARHAPVPEDLDRALSGAIAKIGRVVPGTTVEVLGLQEGALCVQVHAGASSCAFDVPTLALGVLRHALPGVVVRDATPRPVLSD